MRRPWNQDEADRLRRFHTPEARCPRCGAVRTDTGYYEDGQRCHDPRPPVSEPDTCPCGKAYDGHEILCADRPRPPVSGEPTSWGPPGFSFPEDEIEPDHFSTHGDNRAESGNSDPRPPVSGESRWADLPRCSYCNEKGTHAPQCDRPPVSGEPLDAAIEAIEGVLTGMDWLGTGGSQTMADEEEREAWSQWDVILAALGRPGDSHKRVYGDD